jgi:hypothetical protein
MSTQTWNSEVYSKERIGEELLRAVQEMKAGKTARVHRIPVSAPPYDGRLP